MSDRNQRIQVFEDTLDFIDYNKVLADSVEFSKELLKITHISEIPTEATLPKHAWL